MAEGMSKKLTEYWQEVIEKVEYDMNKSLSRSSEPEGRLYKAMRYGSLGGGKRLRPLLVMCSAKMFNVNPANAIKVATAIELVHCYSLMHDDLPCMDNSPLRRGKPSVHIRYGEGTALLAGSALFTLAFDLLSRPEVHEDPYVRLQLIQGLAHAAGGHGMIGGQMLDILPPVERKTDLASMTRLQRMKTGEVFSFACEAGAILGKASMEARRALQAFAHDMGLAFQVIDDLLDVKGSSNDIGKPTGQSEAQGKKNFVTTMGPERAKNQAEILIQQAIQHLEVFGKQADFLREIALFILNRKS